MKQPHLKPQDLVVVLKIAANPERLSSISDLSKALFLSASEVHACLQRCQRAHLMTKDEDGVRPIRANVGEFLLHGVRYTFPAVTGGVSLGFPTAYAMTPLLEEIVQPADLAPVWPHPKGTMRGSVLVPLYPTVPDAALIDRNLYELLALIDAIRVGTARERGLAADHIKRKLL
jgi:hypothetical protein